MARTGTPWIICTVLIIALVDIDISHCIDGVVLGEGKTSQRYSEGGPSKLSFGADQKVSILGDEGDMWRAEINGRVGLVDKRFVVDIHNNANAQEEEKSQEDQQADSSSEQSPQEPVEERQQDSQIPLDQTRQAAQEQPQRSGSEQSQQAEVTEQSEETVPEQPKETVPEQPLEALPEQPNQTEAYPEKAQEDASPEDPLQVQPERQEQTGSEPEKGHEDAPPQQPTQEVPPAQPKQDVPAQQPQQDVPPQQPQQDVPPQQPQQDVPSVEATQDIHPVQSEQDVPPVQATQDVPPVQGTQDVRPPQRHQDVQEQSQNAVPEQAGPIQSTEGERDQPQQTGSEQLSPNGTPQPHGTGPEQWPVEPEQLPSGQPSHQAYQGQGPTIQQQPQPHLPNVRSPQMHPPQYQHQPHQAGPHQAPLHQVEPQVRQNEMLQDSFRADPDMKLTLSAEDMSFEASQMNFGQEANMDDSYLVIDGTTIPLDPAPTTHSSAIPTDMPSQLPMATPTQQEQYVTSLPSSGNEPNTAVNNYENVQPEANSPTEIEGTNTDEFSSQEEAASWTESLEASNTTEYASISAEESAESKSSLEVDDSLSSDEETTDEDTSIDDDDEDDGEDLDNNKEERAAIVEELLSKDHNIPPVDLGKKDDMEDLTQGDNVETNSYTVPQDKTAEKVTEDDLPDSITPSINEHGSNIEDLINDRTSSSEEANYGGGNVNSHDSNANDDLQVDVLSLNERVPPEETSYTSQPFSEEPQDSKPEEPSQRESDVKFFQPSSFVTPPPLTEDEGFVDDFKPNELKSDEDETEPGCQAGNACERVAAGSLLHELETSDQHHQQPKESSEHVTHQQTPEQDPYMDMGSLYEDGQDSMVQHYLDQLSYFIPPELLHALTSSTMPPGLVLLTGSTIAVVLAVWFVFALVEKFSREQPLLTKLAQLEKDLFRLTNENRLLKEEGGKAINGSVEATKAPLITQQAPPPKDPSPELIKELQSTKANLEELKNRFNSEKQSLHADKTRMESELVHVKEELQKAQAELAESEAFVQECVEEKKKSNTSSVDLAKAIDGLRHQLQQQKELMSKYEGKVKRRDNEIKQRTQEVRKLRADAANASLQVTKLTAEKDSLVKSVTELEAKVRETENVASKINELKTELAQSKEEKEEKETLLEARNTEISVLKVNIEQLKKTIGLMKSKKSSEGPMEEREDGDGWECEDDFGDDDTKGGDFDFDKVFNCAQLQVDLQKAQEACSQLSEQLVEAETAKETLETGIKSNTEQLEIARKAKDNAVKERNEFEKKLEVLTNYFNAREAELQKQLGMTANRLSDTEINSESAAKKLSAIVEEMQSYKSQVNTLKNEMEEQERSLKAQVAGLEQKQHESWVTAKQEARKYSEAQKELQTMRSILTAVESKLLNKEFEVDSLSKENETLKETIENISHSIRMKTDGDACFYHPVKKSSASSKVVSFKDDKEMHNHQQDNNVYTNGDTSASSSVAAEPLTSSGPSSLPPDLPPLPPLPDLWGNGESRFNPQFDFRPAPLGHHGGAGYSPDSSNTEDDEAAVDNYYGNLHYLPEDTFQRGHSKSPDRMSNRSGMSSRGFNY